MAELILRVEVGRTISCNGNAIQQLFHERALDKPVVKPKVSIRPTVKTTGSVDCLSIVDNQRDA